MFFERYPTNHKASDGATRSFPDTEDLPSPDSGDLIEIYGDFTSGGECLEIRRHPTAERAKRDRIRLWMAHQVLFGFLSYFTLANFVRSHRAAPGGDLLCQRKPSGGSILGSGPLAMTLTGDGMYRWRALSILFHGPFFQKLLVYAVARNRT